MSIFHRQPEPAESGSPATDTTHPPPPVVPPSPVAPYQPGQVVFILTASRELKPAHVRDKVSDNSIFGNVSFIVETTSGRLRVAAYDIITVLAIHEAMDALAQFQNIA